MHAFIKNLVISVYNTRFIAKKNIYQYGVKERYQKSFQYRVINYFDYLYKESRALQKYEISLQVRKDTLEYNVTQQNLNFIHQLIDDLSSSTKRKTVISLDDLDKRCCTIGSCVSHSEILNLLTAFLKVVPNVLPSTRFYQESLSFLTKGVECNLLKNYEILQLLFLISLQKKKASSQLKYLESYLPNIEDMSLFEKCIVATAFFKASVKVPKSALEIFEKTIKKEAESLILDPPLLVSICKIIRSSDPSDKLDLNELSNAIINLQKPLEFKCIVHVLSLYSEALLFEPEAINRLVTDGIELIKLDSLKPSIRLKDFDRFLWSISHLGLPIAQNKKDILKLYTELRLEEYKSKENLGIFVNSMLCLHMLKCWNIQMINYCFDKNIFESIFIEAYHWKVRSRLQLLINQINLEIMIPIPQALKKTIPIKYQPSQNLQLVTKIGKELVDRGVFKDAVLECPVAHLQIPGVTLKTKKNFSNYHIDVLDNSVCLRNTTIPHGLMDLKLRLLSRLKYKHISISGNIFVTDDMQTNIIEEHILRSVNH